MSYSRRGNERYQHEFVEAVLPPGMTLSFGRGLGSRTFETALRVKRCQWCGTVEGTQARGRRCYGQPVKEGASLMLPVAQPDYMLR